MVSINFWPQKHGNRATTCNNTNTIHLGFSYFLAKIPIPGNGWAWPQMDHMIVLSQNWWFQSIPGLKKHRNRAPTSHNSIYIGFLYFPVKIPTLGNGRGPEIGHMMVLSQNWWFESIPGLKKHRNRAPTCHSSLSIRFSMFAVKIPTLKNGRGPRTPHDVDTNYGSNYVLFINL